MRLEDWQSRLRNARYYLRVLKELFFPRHCVICGNHIDFGLLCDTCRRAFLLQRTLSFAPREEFLAGQAEALPEDVLSSVFLLYKYEGVLKKTLLRAKFEAESDALPLLREEAEAALPQAKLRWLAQYDLITCVPTTAERRQQRGFDLPQELFAQLLEQDGEFRSDVLTRVRATAPLYELAPRERREELTGCFAVNPRLRLQGKRVLLCDDIYTSGSTMCEAARALLAAGAQAVDGLAFMAVESHWR